MADCGYPALKNLFRFLRTFQRMVGMSCIFSNALVEGLFSRRSGGSIPEASEIHFQNNISGNPGFCPSPAVANRLFSFFMDSNPFISICIPARNRVPLLRRLLDSVAAQTYKDFEVIITDNSDDDQVARLADEYPQLHILYNLNDPKTEMGGNWNEALQRARGQWLKLIHDDDWFTDENSLARFAEAARNTNTGFVFSAYYNVSEDTGKKTLVKAADWQLSMLRRSPFSLLTNNVIGPPSVTMIRRDALLPYRAHMKWIVDVEGYIRMLKAGAGFEAILEPAISICIHPEQATHAYFRNPVVEIPEYLDLLQNWPHFHRNIFAYDACWRLMRNLKIRSAKELESFSQGKEIPKALLDIIRFQKGFSPKTLQNGLLSKLLMTVSWLRSQALFSGN